MKAKGYEYDHIFSWLEALDTASADVTLQVNGRDVPLREAPKARQARWLGQKVREENWTGPAKPDPQATLPGTPANEPA